MRFMVELAYLQPKDLGLYTAHLPRVQIASWKEKLQLSGTQTISETLLGIL